MYGKDSRQSTYERKGAELARTASTLTSTMRHPRLNAALIQTHTPQRGLVELLLPRRGRRGTLVVASVGGGPFLDVLIGGAGGVFGLFVGGRRGRREVSVFVMLCYVR